MISIVNAAATGDLSNKDISNSIPESKVLTSDDIIKRISPNIIVDKSYSRNNGVEVNGIFTYKNIAENVLRGWNPSDDVNKLLSYKKHDILRLSCFFIDLPD